jgi:hypothetical protein
MLIFFGVLILGLGILLTMPFLPRQNIPLGIGISAAAVVAIAAGRVWLRHLPVVMRLTPEGLEILRKRTTYRWSDIDQVAVKTIYVKGKVSYLCLRLKPEAKERYDLEPDGWIIRAIKAIGGDFDFAFNGQELSLPADLLKTKIEQRLRGV